MLQDGIALAWALSEHLTALGAYTVFATHFARLVHLEQLYPNCKAMQFGCQQQHGRVVFNWKLDPHGSQHSRYGLLLAPQVLALLVEGIRSMPRLHVCWWRHLIPCREAVEDMGTLATQ